MASKTSLVALVLTGALGLGGVTSHARRVDQRNVWVLNNTNREISELYVSPHESDRWGQDVLGQVTLPHGVGTVISFDSRSASSCIMDFRIVYRNGSVQVYNDGRNVCQILAVQFNDRTSIGLQ
jgi:hypothetical protein